MEMLGGKETLEQCRKPEIMADAAYAVLTGDSMSRTGEFLIDDTVLKEVGVTNFDSYAYDPSMTSIKFLIAKFFFFYCLIESNMGSNRILH